MIEKPPFQEPKKVEFKKDSIIQIPISIDTKEIEDAILGEVQSPISRGITKKITADIFATDKISKEEFKNTLQQQIESSYYSEKYKEIKKSFSKFLPESFELITQPTEASYKFLSKDITDFLDKSFKAGMWVKHYIYLKDLQISFEGSKVKIFSSYTIDVMLDYEQNLFTFSDPSKVKSLLTGSIEANIELMGKVTIDTDAKLHIEAIEDGTKIKFEKIKFPYTLDILDILKVTQMESFLTKKILEEPINKEIFKQLQNQIAKKQVDIQLAQRIQKLVYENASPFHLGDDLWLVPEASQISLSQINAQNSECTNTLSINIGITAKPVLVSGSDEPQVSPPKSVPIVCETLVPKIYLYPSIEIQYNFVASMIEKELQVFIQQNYGEEKYSISNITIYPSDTRLVIGIDLVEKENAQKRIRFYLWGTPKLDTANKVVYLENLDYTLESKNYLFKIAHWLLDEKMKNIIQEKATFNYDKELTKLSQKLANLEDTSGKRILNGSINTIEIQNIFTSKDALIVNTIATGNLSYEFKLYTELKENK